MITWRFRNQASASYSPLRPGGLVVVRCIACLLWAVCGAGCHKLGGPGGGQTKTYPIAGVVAPQITLRPQLQTNWCWAASAEMVIEWGKKLAPQCEQLTSYESQYHINHFSGNCCPLEPACNVTAFPNKSFHDAKLKFSETAEGVALSPEVIEEEIGEKHRPIVFSWLWTNKCSNGQRCGHMMVIESYIIKQGYLILTVDDPDPVPNLKLGVEGGTIQTYFYDQFKVAPETYTHWKDFYGFTDDKGSAQ